MATVLPDCKQICFSESL